jgi:hypothetical protein
MNAEKCPIYLNSVESDIKLTLRLTASCKYDAEGKQSDDTDERSCDYEIIISLNDFMTPLYNDVAV